MERPQSQWGGTPADNSNGYPVQPASSSGSPQQTCGVGTSETDVTLGAGAPPPRDQSLASPVPSPYPATVAEPPAAQHEDDLQQPSPEQQAVAALTEATERANSCFTAPPQQPPPPQVS